MDILRSLYKLFTSYALAVVVLVLLTVITLLGTLEQGPLGLWAAVNKYFHSWFVVSDIFENAGLFKLPIPLPGGLLLMVILFINMTLGGLVHVRKRLRGVPNLISHCGILLLLISAFVTFIGKNDGFVALYPGQASNTARSYKEWQLEIIEFNDEQKPVKSYIIPSERLLEIGSDGEQLFTSKALPFSLQIDHYHENATPLSASAPMAAGAGNRVIEGYKLLSRKKNREAERNYPGCFAKVLVGDEQKVVKEMLISAYCTTTQYQTPNGESIVMQIPGTSPRAAGFEVDGKQYGLLLNKKSWPIDYYIKLDRFIFDKHPGTNQPKNYESRITRLDTLEDEGKKVAIRMNEPMRHSGFVVFQESYGQHPVKGIYHSQFAVSDNPSDQWPTIALTIMGIGLLLHFIWKLVEYINKSKATRLKTEGAKS